MTDKEIQAAIDGLMEYCEPPTDLINGTQQQKLVGIALHALFTLQETNINRKRDLESMAQMKEEARELKADKMIADEQAKHDEECIQEFKRDNKLLKDVYEAGTEVGAASRARRKKGMPIWDVPSPTEIEALREAIDAYERREGEG